MGDATSALYVIAFCLYNMPVMLYSYIFTIKCRKPIINQSPLQRYSPGDLEQVGQGHPYEIRL